MKLRRAPEDPEAARRPKASILLVDDDLGKLVSLRAILEPLGENIVEAHSGTDALRQLLRENFAVILLDVRMPIMNGFETAEMIRARPASELTPIIFVTALDEVETDMARGYELGAVDFVFAPVVPPILRAKVQVFVELYKAQQELKRYRDQLQALVQERTATLTAVNRELEAFNSVVSHDFKGPMATLQTSTRALESAGDKLDPQTLKQVQRVRRASGQISAMFDGVQTLFRITRGELRREQIDASRMARQIVDELRAAEPGRSVEVEIATDMRVEGDAKLVRILLNSLINNAWKFTRNETQATVRVGQEVVGGEMRTYVRDNGVGFDMIYAHRLFGAFQRLHSQSEFPGEGIGLASAQRIVNRHGGRIWAEGAVGEGASFYFVL